MLVNEPPMRHLCSYSLQRFQPVHHPEHQMREGALNIFRMMELRVIIPRLDKVDMGATPFELVNHIDRVELPWPAVQEFGAQKGEVQIQPPRPADHGSDGFSTLRARKHFAGGGRHAV